jgi:hypothetical protein
LKRQQPYSVKGNHRRHASRTPPPSQQQTHANQTQHHTLGLRGLVRTITRILGGSAMFMASPIAPSVMTACIQTVAMTRADRRQNTLLSKNIELHIKAITRNSPCLCESSTAASKKHPQIGIATQRNTSTVTKCTWTLSLRETAACVDLQRLAVKREHTMTPMRNITRIQETKYTRTLYRLFKWCRSGLDRNWQRSKHL